MSSFGYVLFGVGESYLRLTYATALSIKNTHHPDIKISIITDQEVPEEWRSVFDQVIKIKSNDNYHFGRAVYDRCFIYELSPYDITAHIESDCLVLDNLMPWWDHIFNDSNNYLKFSTNIVHIDGSLVDVENHPVHRLEFRQAGLPFDLRVAVFCFKKDNRTTEFFENLKNNVLKYQMNTFDATVAVTVHEEGLYDVVADRNISWTHGKSLIIGDWQSANVIFTHTGELFVNGFRQNNVFHYSDKDWLTDNHIKILEDLYEGRWSETHM